MCAHGIAPLVIIASGCFQRTRRTFVGNDSLHPQATWRFSYDGTTSPTKVRPRLGDVFDLALKIPASEDDIFTFTTGAEHVDGAHQAYAWEQKPYVVPNPYVAAASFEPQIYNTSGRGDRRIRIRRGRPTPGAATRRGPRAWSASRKGQ